MKAEKLNGRLLLRDAGQLLAACMAHGELRKEALGNVQEASIDYSDGNERVET